MDRIFGFGKPDEKEQKRRNARELRTASREMGKDRRQLEEKEAELEKEIRQLAKKGQREACAVLAKQLVQLRRQKVKNSSVGAMLTSTQARQSQASSMGTMARAMGSSASAMGAMNAALPIGKMQQQMDAFARESQMAEMKSELVDETLDAMLDVGEEGEEESDRMVAAILDEIGVETQEKLSGVPRPALALPGESSAVRTRKQPAKDAEDVDVDRLIAELTANK